MKNNNQYLLILFAVLLNSFYSSGQEDNVVFENKIFNTNILTPLLHTENNPMSNPIIHFDNPLLSFLTYLPRNVANFLPLSFFLCPSAILFTIEEPHITASDNFETFLTS